MAVGGGSGGHVVPIVAVFKEILKKDLDVKLYFWCDKKFAPQAQKIMNDSFGRNVKISKISSGKFRRYNHLTFFQHLTIPSVVFGNLADIFRNIAGVFQSFVKLIFLRPDVIFCKGGFVCVPVGLSAWVLRIPIVIHDSDAHPGLANRIISKFAKKIATGAPLEFYNYPKEISKYVGIPVLENFKKYTEKERNEFKQELGFSKEKPLIVITGGGLGAARLNNAIVAQGEELSKIAQVVLISGVAQFEELKEKTKDFVKDFHLVSFISKDMWKFLASADLVVARAGATSNLELAALHKSTILVPNARLTGGHQLKNAKVYEKTNAVKIVSDDEIETNPKMLSDEIIQVLSSEKELKRMGEEFGKFAKPNAAKDVADMILDLANL